MTRHRRQTTDDRQTNSQTMRDVSHSSPYDDRGATNDVFARGPRVVTDGGRDQREQTMADVDHTPPAGAPGANRVFERGNEGRRDSP